MIRILRIRNTELVSNLFSLLTFSPACHISLLGGRTARPWPLSSVPGSHLAGGIKEFKINHNVACIEQLIYYVYNNLGKSETTNYSTKVVFCL